MFAKLDKFLLIEFKIDGDAIDSELDKYEKDDARDNYQIAKKKLERRDGHHLLVYGSDVLKSEGKAALMLGIQSYFKKEFTVLDEVETKGVSKRDFDRYLKILLRYKKKDGRASVGSSRSPTSTVIGVSSSARGTMSLSEYIDIYLPNIYRPELEVGATFEGAKKPRVK